VRLEDLARVAEVVPGAQRALVGLGELGLRRELGPDPVDGRLERPVVEPVHQAEREEILTAVDVLLAEAHALQGPRVHRRDRHLEHPIWRQRLVLERVLRVPGLPEVVRAERVGVRDDDPVLREVAEVRLERGRVHGDEDIGLVARRPDVTVAEVDLEAGDAGERPGGRADLGREVGQRADVVADDRRRVGELRPGQLHAVPRIAREPDRHTLEFLDVVVDGVLGNRR
jgi:hypothetical protein